SDSPGERGSDARIEKIQFGSVEISLIELDRPLILMHQVHLVIPYLQCYRILLGKDIVPLQVHFGLFKQRLVPCQLALRLEHRRCVRPWVDLHQQRSLLYDVTFLEQNLHYLPVNPCVYGDGIERGDCAEPCNIYIDISLFGGDGYNRNARWRGGRLPGCAPSGKYPTRIG